MGIQTLEVLLGQQHVGIDIGPVQGNDDTAVLYQGLHVHRLLKSINSPATAAAAAMAGDIRWVRPP